MKTLAALALVLAAPATAHAHHEELVELVSSPILWPFILASLASLWSSLRGGKR